MKLLLQFNENSKMREISDLAELHEVIERTFQLGPSTYFIQKFDRDFNDFVDIEDESVVADKDKIRVLLLQRTETALPIENNMMDNSLTFSSELVNLEEVQDVIILPPHSEQWPDQINIPFENFSKGLKDDLQAETKLSWDRSRELIGHLANYAYSFKPYPNKEERLQICHALVRSHPYLRNNIGVGIGGWEVKLLNKLKKLRQADTSLEVKLNRCNSKVAGSKAPKHLNINPKKGELNWSPDHIAGETPDSVKLHKRILKEESLKAEKYQDKTKIYALMALTYSFRREQINSKIPISDLKAEYPILFQKNEQYEEFKRLTAVSITENFYQEVARQGPELYELFSRKKKSPDELSLLTSFNEQCLDMDEKKRLEAQIAFGFFTLPYLLREDINSIFKIVSDDDDTPDYNSPSPRVFIYHSFLAGTFVIISEGVELFRGNNFIDIIGLLMSFYYTLNISYPSTAINTLKFLQNSILKIRGGSVPPKVQTLLNKIKR